jgi:hypothetical protein
MPKPIGKPGEKKDLKLDKRNKEGSSLKAFYAPKGIAIGTSFQPGVRMEHISEMKKRRIGGSRNAR